MPYKVKQKAPTTKMDKRRLRIALKVSDKVRIRFLYTKQFIEDSTHQECLKENISANEVILFTSIKAKS